MVPLVITVEGLQKTFADEKAVCGLSFTVASNRLFGLVGADGAGKTTLLRMLTTLLPPDSGNATVLGKGIGTDARFIRSNIGYMPQRFSLYGDLSVMENLDFFADVFGVTGSERKKRIARLLEFSRLTPFVGRAAGKLSGGMKQKLALCCALVHTPPLLLLDEPTTGVDPVSRREFWEILRSLRQEGISIVITTPYMDEAGWCDEVLFMHNGKRLLQGVPSDLTAGFGHAVYRLTGSDDGAVLYCPSTIRLPPEFCSIYPSGGALHLVARKDAGDPAELLRRVRELVPEARTIERHEPDMEDLFFYHLASVREDSATTGVAAHVDH